MSNTFSYGKCWNFGKMVKKEYGGTWAELNERQDWKEFKGQYRLSDNQIFYVKRGFMGRPFQDEDPIEHNSGDNEIVPFGKFKGRKFKELSVNYLRWLHEQEWLEKWPTLAVYVHLRIAEEDEKKLSPEEIKATLRLD